jgi:hypothetical protein
VPVETGPPSRNSESPLIPGVMDASRPPSDLLQGWSYLRKDLIFRFHESHLTNLFVFNPSIFTAINITH